MDTDDLAAFKDTDKISPDQEAQAAMKWAVAVEIIIGRTGGLLDPQGTVTRAEVAVAINRLEEWLKNQIGRAHV